MSSEEEDGNREERFILQHNLRSGQPTVRLPRQILPHQSDSQQPTISQQHGRGGPPPPPPPPPLMTPWTDPSSGWQAGFQPWLTGGPPAPLSLPFMAGPSHSPSAFSRPGFSTHTPREFLERPVQPGFNRPLGPSSTLIQHAEPEPGEVTIEKCEPWTPAPPAPPPVSPPTTASPPAQTSPPRLSPPARRMRLRDIMTSAVRSALNNPQLDQEAERFNNEIGATFMEALGTVLKKEK